jgi:hypothetical protein
MLTDSDVSRPVVKQLIMMEGHSGAELLTSWQPESRKRDGRARDKVPFNGLLPVTYFLKPGHNSYCFPIMTSDYEPINVLIH